MESKLIQLKWVASRVFGALVAVCGADSGVSPFLYHAPVRRGGDRPEHGIGVHGALTGVDVVSLRVVSEESSIFRFIADMRCLGQISLTVSAKFRKAVRRVRTVTLNCFRDSGVNLQHLYLRERRLRQ